MAVAIERRAPSTAPPVDFTDPKASLAYLFNPNAPLSEVDTAAAEAAVGGGFGIGSPFAQNNQIRMRDSERLSRLKLGHELLNPFLQRDFAAGQQNQQIAAQAASDALKESGAMARLSAEGQQRLQLALIQGDQQAADRLLTESGLDRRSSAGLAASLQESTQRNQTSLLQSLLPYAAGGRGGGGGGGAGGTGPVRGGANDISTSWGPTSGANPFTHTDTNAGGDGVPHWGDPNYARTNAGGGGFGGGTGLSGKLGSTLDAILRQYKLI